MSMRMFVSTLCFVSGTIFFGLGVCMSVLDSWNLTRQGHVITVIGAVLLMFLCVYRKRTKPYKIKK